MPKKLFKNTVKVNFLENDEIQVEFLSEKLTLNHLKDPKEKLILREIRKIGWDVRAIKEFFPRILPDKTYETEKRVLAITDWTLASDQFSNTIWISEGAFNYKKKYDKKYEGVPPELSEILVHEMSHAVIFNNPIIQKERRILLERIGQSDFIPESLHIATEELNHGKIFQIIYSQLCEKYDIEHDPRYWRRSHKRDPFKKLRG